MKFETTRNATVKEVAPKVHLKVNLETNYVTFSKTWWEENNINRLAHSTVDKHSTAVYLCADDEGLIRKGKATNLVDKLKKVYPGNNIFSLEYVEEDIEIEELENQDIDYTYKMCYYEIIPLGYVAPKKYTPEQLEELKERGKKLAQSRVSMLNNVETKNEEEYQEEVDALNEIV